MMPTSPRSRHEVYSVPGVYREPRPRQLAFARVRTDIAGFVGVAGPRRVGDAVPVDDWRSYVETFLRDDRGDPIEPPPGAQLADAVRAYFANGGARCWVVNAAEAIEASRADALLADMLGLASASGPTADRAGRRGLEQLLARPEVTAEVTIAALPELDATIVVDEPRAWELPPSAEDSVFSPCTRFGRTPGAFAAPPVRRVARRLYTDAAVQWAQRYAIERCQREPWRAFAIFAPPPGLTPDQAIAWRAAVTENVATADGDPGADCAALYWPWPLIQDLPGLPVEPRSPVGYVAGIIARRDLARGPHVAPAGEGLVGVVGLEREIDDEVVAAVYDRGINALRVTPSNGVVVWGARTLRWQEPPASGAPPNPLVYVSARRCLTAIERTVERIGQPAVFEPNAPLLRAQVAQAVTGYMTGVFESGALAGASAEQAFFVRCDSALNPPEAAANGQLVCQVGVALAAPAEFIVFRVGRREGVVEIAEHAYAVRAPASEAQG